MRLRSTLGLLLALALGPPSLRAIAAPPAALPPAIASAGLLGGSPIDLRAPAAAELRLVPGIGPVLAQRIAENAPYESWDAVAKVHGVGRARARVLAEYAVLRRL
ncbi:MAG: hypothetical protein U1E65_13795 [Myxococcota bacterium]